MTMRILSMSVCPSDCLSVMRNDRTKLPSAYVLTSCKVSPSIFLTPVMVGVGYLLLSKISAQNDPLRSKNADFKP